MSEQISYGTAECGHVGQIFETGKCAHCYISDLEREKKEMKLTLDCMTCKSWPEVCQKCYERRK